MRRGFLTPGSPCSIKRDQPRAIALQQHFAIAFNTSASRSAYSSTDAIAFNTSASRSHPVKTIQYMIFGVRFI
ncbi:hypothetical protein NWP21_15680 [Anabaenopsis sp. FSS-46]|uniref:hypothetical protein n=1 Tax=Anabaenopsis sp. FSS-46 TaxID=2971766 RepID=UPI00247335A9|nr:hypothetical protein [Anabaenopsis sp. FSS-46]MDH6100253.1 hypothetical protein [Anabaenopsis sp. FSS-46]